MSRPMSSIRTALPPIPESPHVNSPTSTIPAARHYIPPPTIEVLSPSASAVRSNVMDATVATEEIIGGMPKRFWILPARADAAFSTSLGRFPKRELPDPTKTPWPAQVVRSNLSRDVYQRVDALRAEYPRVCRLGVSAITSSNDWMYLYRYFDSWDLWVEGPVFCMHVINRIAAIEMELKPQHDAMIDMSAKEWVDNNHELLFQNPGIQNPIDLFDEYDRPNLDHMALDEVLLLKERLKYHAHILFLNVQECNRRNPQLLPPTIEFAHPGTMGPFPGRMPVFPPHGFPPNSSIMHPLPPIPPPSQGPQLHRHQTFNQFLETATRSQVLPNNNRNENYRPIEGRPRGWSNDTARNGRASKQFGGFYNNNGTHNGRRYGPATPRESPPRQVGPAEPIYVLRNQHSSPQGQQSARKVIEPANHRDAPDRNGQRAVSDSPSSRRIFSGESVNATAMGRRASTNDAIAPSNFLKENMIASQDSPVETSGNSTPRAARINDARVLEALEKGESGNLTSPAHRLNTYSAPTPPNNPSQNHIISNHAQDNVEFLERPSSTGLTQIYFYGPRRSMPAAQNGRTVYVGGLPHGLFLNHTMKNKLSEIGEVENISYLVGSKSRCSFVVFVDESSVDKAIYKLDGASLGGHRMTVNLPRGSRERADSYSSQRSYQSTTNMGTLDYDRPTFGRDTNNRHARQFSRHSYDAHQHSRSSSRQFYDPPPHDRNLSNNSNEFAPPRIEGKLVSSVSELVQHNSALNRIPMPLENIENRMGYNSASNSPAKNPNYEIRYGENRYAGGRQGGEPYSQTGPTNQKENSPTKNDRPHPPMTPSRKGSFTSQGPGSKHKSKIRKVSRHNSMTSASATPTKSRSEANLNILGAKSAADTKINDPVLPDKLTTMEIEKLSATVQTDKSTQKANGSSRPNTSTEPEGEQEPLLADKPKQKKKSSKRKKNASKTDGENPVMSAASSNTSFITQSSDTFEATSPVGTENSRTSFKTSKSTNTSFSTAPSHMPSDFFSRSTTPKTETPDDNDHLSMKGLPPKTTETEENSATPRPSKSSIKKSKSEVPPRSASGNNNHAKKESEASATSTPSSARKADAKSQTKSDNEEASESAIKLNDQKEFPSLGPVKSSPPETVDGKRTPALAAMPKFPGPGTLAERVVSGVNKNPVKPAVPIVAVPRSFQPRPQPASGNNQTDMEQSRGARVMSDGLSVYDTKVLGSRAWPFSKQVTPLPP